jgi:hypothetical protein
MISTIFSRHCHRLLRGTIGAFVLLVTAAGTSSAAGPDLLGWADCPPGQPYDFAGALPAHFQTSPVAGPSGGSCSLDVVSGSDFVAAANSAGGVFFASPGEVSGNTYTLAFDFQFVSGHHTWGFSNQNSDGFINGLSFSVPFPGDNCWRHYEFTAPLGPNGPKDFFFINPGVAGPEEVRIDNMTLRLADPGATRGLTVGSAGSCSCGSGS